MFWGFEVYFNLLVLLVVDCNKLTKMKKKMMEFYFQTKVPQKVLTHTHTQNKSLEILSITYDYFFSLNYARRWCEIEINSTILP